MPVGIYCNWDIGRCRTCNPELLSASGARGVVDKGLRIEGENVHRRNPRKCTSDHVSLFFLIEKDAVGFIVLHEEHSFMSEFSRQLWQVHCGMTVIEYLPPRGRRVFLHISQLGYLQVSHM